MRIHAIRTGSVRIKQSQVRGRGRGVLRRLRVFAGESFRPFGASTKLTKAGDVVAVPTPGHTAGHLSVIALDEGIAFVIAGDTSYTEALMLAGQVDGVSADDETAQATLSSLERFAAERPMVYLPTHDPESAERLSQRRLVVTRSSVGAPPVSADGRNVIEENQRVT
jgi:glyoxylase-like metal-dependent hydrolase (beta-lactamase superfamily II)